MAKHWVEEADHPLIARFLSPLDRHLRRRQEIFEYTPNPCCIFRLQELRLYQSFVLSDGTHFKFGERVLDLHLWNEQVPPLRTNSLRWARRMNECLDTSLHELAHYLAQRTDLSDVRVIRANMAFGTPQQSAQLVRISGWYGFEPIPSPDPHGLRELAHRFGENILISLMVLARNKAALRLDSLWRDRTQVFLSRNILDRRYGIGPSRGAREALGMNLGAL